MHIPGLSDSKSRTTETNFKLAWQAVALSAPIAVSAIPTLFIIAGFGKTLSWTPIYYTFFTSVVLFLALWISVMRQLHWLTYVGLIALMLPHEAAVDGSLFTLLGVPQSTAPYWIVITGLLVAAWGFFTSGYLVERSHRFNAMRRPVFIAAALCLLSIPLLSLIDASSMRTYTNVAILLMIFCNVVTPFSWKNNMPRLRAVVFLNFGWVFALNLIYFFMFPDASNLDGASAENFRRILISFTVLSSLIIYSAMVQFMEDQRLLAITEAIAAVDAESVANRALLESERRYRSTQELVRYRSKQLRSAAHDIRQPLNSLRTMITRLAKDHSENIDRQIAETVDYIDTVAIDYLTAAPGANEPEGSIEEDFESSVVLQTLHGMYIDEASARNVSLKIERCTAVINSAPLPLIRVLGDLISCVLQQSNNSKILLGCRRRAHEVWFELHLAGSSIAPDLWTTEAQRANPGIGLDDSINTICSLQGFRYEYELVQGRGLIARIGVKLAIQTSSVELNGEL